MQVLALAEHMKEKYGLKTRDMVRILGVAASCGIALTAFAVARLSHSIWLGAGIGLVLGVGGYFLMQRWPGYGSPSLPSLLLESPNFAEVVGRAGRSSVRIVAMSDTHNTLDDETARNLPSGDVFVHAGDMTDYGSSGELRAFNEWLSKIKSKFQYVVVVCGNHDILTDPSTYEANRDLLEKKMGASKLPPRDPVATMEYVRRELLSHATHVLVDETITLSFADGRNLTLFGSPRVRKNPRSAVSAYSCSEEELAAFYERSAVGQPKVDLYVTHGPPHQVLDRAFFGKPLGSRALAAHLARLTSEGRAPTYHIFGHVHEGRGVRVGGADLVRSATPQPRDRAASRSERKAARADATLHVPTTFVNLAGVNLFHELRPETRSSIVFDVPVAAAAAAGSGGATADAPR